MIAVENARKNFADDVKKALSEINAYLEGLPAEEFAIDQIRKYYRNITFIKFPCVLIFSY